jgi:hypothetical protein
MNRYDSDKEKLHKEYELALKEFTIEKEEREDIYRECRAIDKTLIDCLGYCNETELMEEEFTEFKKQSDREMQEMEDRLISLKKKIRGL